ncbi:amine oxidase [copper-containing] 2-like [Spheniscus humboldti]
MHMKTVLLLLVLALATIFALVCVLLTRGRAPSTCQHQPREQEDTDDGQSLVFADLTPEEMVQVVRYLQGNLGVQLVDASRAKPSDNCIASVDVQVPAKAEVLRFLDGGGARPPREALAVLYFGNQPDPNVTEYVVGPLPTPAYHRDVTVQKYGGKVPYHRRPTLAVEYKQMAGFLKSQVFPTAPSFMHQVMEYDGASLAALTAAPRGFQSGDRITWFVLFQNVSGFFVHPVGLEVLVDHSSLDISRWAVNRVFYNGQYYRDMVQLESAYVQGRISVEKVRKAPRDGDFSSMKPRAPSAALFPLQYEPQGPRYSIRNNHVLFQAWSFAFGVSVNTGLRLFDIRHKGERVAYEIGIQEALSVYGSNCPGGMSTRYMDGSFGIGRYTSPLVRGVDCPYLATYLDVHYLAHSHVSRISKNALCIFEQNLGSPLRRHYSNLQSLYYGGLVNSALVVRSIATVGNYDYVWDFIFYQNGAIEGKVQATGYASSSFLHGDGLRYGNRIWEHTLGTIHTHSINYKVDLDVGGRSGSSYNVCHYTVSFATGMARQTGRHSPVCRAEGVSLFFLRLMLALAFLKGVKWTTISGKPFSAVGDVLLPPHVGLGTVGPALQKLVAMQEQPPHTMLLSKDPVCWSGVGMAGWGQMCPVSHPAASALPGAAASGTYSRCCSRTPCPVSALREMNPKLPYVLLAGAAVIIFILSCMLLSRGRRSPSCESQPRIMEKMGFRSQSLVFADLTPEEMVQVVRYLQGNLGVQLVDASRAKPSDNCIASVDVQVPAKAEVLRFLDGGGARPPREALAVLYFGNQPDPNVTEYVVGPLPTPAYHRDVTVQKYGGKVPYHRRPMLGSEYEQVGAFLETVAFAAAPTFLKEVFEYDGTNVAFQTTAPHGFQSGDRKSWFIVFQNVSGFFVHPVGLEVLVDHSSLDISRWAVNRVFYNGQYYRDMVQLESAYVQGRISVEKVRKAPRDGDFSSMKPRAPSAALFPLQYEPQGPRYSIRNNHVLFQAWSFAFGMSVNTGLRLFDIRHKGERVAYEIGIQEALSVYGSNCPGGMSTRYMDGSFGIGRYTSPLVRGVDCPYSATYVDTHSLFETLSPSKRKASLCIFEQNLGSPLRRHYSNLQSLYYGGLVNSALVVRSIATVGNHDYVWDFIFYQNGAIEGKVQATGYASSSFLHGDGLRYGNRVWEHTLGTIRTHSINYKVDLDVGGVKNSLVAHDMAFEMVRAPWSPEQQIERPRLTKKVLDTEDQAAFRLQSKMPRYIYFAANSKNKWGHQRGYRIQITSFAGDHVPEASSMERAISWARYQLAVTRRKEEEPTSTSIYNQNDPWTPTVTFANFINNETITNEDLVAWITTGFLHIPHSEDIPNTVTVGNSVGFLLRPYNYYDLDPSIYSHDGVFFTSEQDFTACEINPIACLPKTASCLPNFPPFTYDGFQNMSRL